MVSTLSGPIGLRVRIVAALLVSFLASQAAMGFLLSQWRGVARVQSSLTQAWLPLAEDTDGLQQFQQRLEADVERLLRDVEPIRGTPAARVYSEALADRVAVANIHVLAVDSLAQTAAERALAHQAAAQLERIGQLDRAVSAAVGRLVEAGDRSGAEAMRKDLRALADEVSRLRRLAVGRVSDLNAEAEARRTRATALAAIGAASALVVSAAMAVAVLFALRPIQRLTAEVRRVAAGDRLRPVEIGGTDEIGALAAGFDEMARALDARDTALQQRADELNRLSRYLGSVLDGLGEALIVVEDGVVTLANPAAVAVWGAEVGRPLPEALRQDGPAQGTQGTLHEVRRRPFGDTGHVVVASDVTDAMRTRDRLARSERLAVVGQMLAQVTHEVRNPLNALSLNAELLAEELAALDAERRTEAWEILGVVTGEIERLTAVTAHYLQLARPAGSGVLPEDLGQMLLDVARLLGPEMERGGVHLDVAAGPATVLQVDGARIRQALVNIVRNAAQAGARVVSLSCEVDAAEVRLVAEDDGPGFDAATRDRAGEPFFTTRPDGTGLGLAVSRQAVEAQGGELRLGGASGGRGARVVLALPLV
jgi:nitrogen fixation/metabolism regulation signal transduction histidine kinase